MATTFKQLQFQDKNLQLLQDNVRDVLTQLLAMPMVGGNSLTGVDLTAGQDNKVAHKLGHTPQFFIVTNLNADSTVWQTAMDDSFITMRCSASCTVSLWVN